MGRACSWRLPVSFAVGCKGHDVFFWFHLTVWGPGADFEAEVVQQPLRLKWGSGAEAGRLAGRGPAAAAGGTCQPISVCCRGTPSEALSHGTLRFLFAGMAGVALVSSLHLWGLLPVPPPTACQTGWLQHLGESRANDTEGSVREQGRGSLVQGEVGRPPADKPWCHSLAPVLPGPLACFSLG